MYARMTPLRLKSKVSHTSWLKTDMRRQGETEREREYFPLMRQLLHSYIIHIIVATSIICCHVLIR